ncbi:MAG: hypothetical protein U9P44_01320, partial [archaeon]|nr:hypothetical protein [archaeon]
MFESIMLKSKIDEDFRKIMKILYSPARIFSQEPLAQIKFNKDSLLPAQPYIRLINRDTIRLRSGGYLCFMQTSESLIIKDTIRLRSGGYLCFMQTSES